jgi:hypothetical protein
MGLKMNGLRLGWRVLLPALCILSVTVAASAQEGSGAPPRPPAEFTASGGFAGGKAGIAATLTGVRFGKVDNATRMVLDFGEATVHPEYTFEIKQFPYRLVAHFSRLTLASAPNVQQKGALPFSIVTTPDGLVKELQIFLPGPVEYKIIEIDDPAKLSIDVRRTKADVPDIYTVQLTAPQTAAEAYALAEHGQFPEGFKPEVLVIGQFVVLEQAFTEPAAAAAMDSALREMGYASVINERGGAELPQR